MNPTLRYITESLQGFVPDAELRETALWIAESATGCSRTEILCKDTTNIPNLEIILQRIRNGEPLQYIFGVTDWGGFRLNVNRNTLIPRPETFEMVELLRKRFAASSVMRVLDIGTGSGCIAIALKKHFIHWEVSACDISPDTLQVAQQNAQSNNTEVHFFLCDILQEEISDFDLIVSNPPYVRESEKKQMMPRVLQWEPDRALFVPDSDPLIFYRRIASLHKAPLLFFEINENLANDTQQMLHTEGYDHCRICKDIYKKDRFIIAQQ